MRTRPRKTARSWTDGHATPPWSPAWRRRCVRVSRCEGVGVPGLAHVGHDGHGDGGDGDESCVGGGVWAGGEANGTWSLELDESLRLPAGAHLHPPNPGRAQTPALPETHSKYNKLEHQEKIGTGLTAWKGEPLS